MIDLRRDSTLSSLLHELPRETHEPTPQTRDKLLYKSIVTPKSSVIVVETENIDDTRVHFQMFMEQVCKERKSNVIKLFLILAIDKRKKCLLVIDCS